MQKTIDVLPVYLPQPVDVDFLAATFIIGMFVHFSIMPIQLNSASAPSSKLYVIFE